MRELSEIKVIRKRLGITQKELARKANVSQSVIAKVERNQLNLSYDKAKRIFDTLADLEQKSSKKIEEIMTPNIIGIKEGSSLIDASQKMHEQGYSQLPIIGSKGNIIGTITDKIFTKLISQGEKDLHVTKVEEVMGEPFPTVDKNVSVRAVARLLEERRAVIVKDKGNYIGIVTRDNLLREFE
ncbi:MAG: CBS domain-containing protein [Candidatus Methanofastidiosa archaeon]|nr:CBS domain-containing protein [Candidatus Methanofastidiosa archaeon]